MQEKIIIQTHFINDKVMTWRYITSAFGTAAWALPHTARYVGHIITNHFERKTQAIKYKHTRGGFNRLGYCSMQAHYSSCLLAWHVSNQSL